MRHHRHTGQHHIEEAPDGLEIISVQAYFRNGLPPGLYHYDSLGHRLELLADRGRTVDRILGYARAAGAMPDVPQVEDLGVSGVPYEMTRADLLHANRDLLAFCTDLLTNA